MNVVAPFFKKILISACLIEVLLVVLFKEGSIDTVLPLFPKSCLEFYFLFFIASLRAKMSDLPYTIGSDLIIECTSDIAGLLTDFSSSSTS